MPDYSLPPWIVNPPNYGESFARGAAPPPGIGHSFAASMQRARDNEREDALFPIKQQVMQQQMQAAALDLEVAQEKRVDGLANKTAFAALSRTMADISQAGAWNDPKAEGRVWELGSRWPTLVDTKEFRDAVGQFDKAAAADRLKAAADARAAYQQGTIEVQRERIGAQEDRYKAEIASKEKIAGDATASREKIASEHDATQKEIARLRMESSQLDKAHDVLPQAQYAKYREIVRNISKDESLNPAAKERKMNEALDRLRDSLETDRQKKGQPAAPAAGGSKVRMTGPDGKLYDIPAENVEKAKARGFK
jgi:hypothetical protein